MKSKFKRPMKLAELLEAYIASRPGLKAASVRAYRDTLRSFEMRLRRKAAVTDLTAESINFYIAYRLSKFSPSTAKRDRKMLVMWWLFAARQQLLPPPIPGCVPTVKVPERIPLAWAVNDSGTSQTDGEPITSQNASLATVAKLLVVYAAKRQLTVNTQSYHRSTLKALERFLKRPALLTDLT